MSEEQKNSLMEEEPTPDSPEEPVSLEAALDELESILTAMEDREVTLEESFALYQKGLARLQYARQRLDAVEKQVLMLEQDGRLVPFEEQEQA